MNQVEMLLLCSLAEALMRAGKLQLQFHGWRRNFGLKLLLILAHKQPVLFLFFLLWQLNKLMLTLFPNKLMGIYDKMTG